MSLENKMKNSPTFLLCPIISQNCLPPLLAPATQQKIFFQENILIEFSNLIRHPKKFMIPNDIHLKTLVWKVFSQQIISLSLYKYGILAAAERSADMNLMNVTDSIHKISPSLFWRYYTLPSCVEYFLDKISNTLTFFATFWRQKRD